MTVVNDDGVHEDEFEATVASLPPDIKRVYITAKADTEKPAAEVVRPEPYGLNPPEGNPIQTYMQNIENTIRDIPNAPENFRKELAQREAASGGKYSLAATGADINNTLDVAMNVGGVGSIVGSAANLGKATQLARFKASIDLARGKNPETVRQETGWFDSGGRLKYEISDENMKLKDIDWKYGQEGKLSDFIEHPELFEAYPHLKDINFKVAEKDYKYIGSFNDATKTLTINPNAVRAGDEGLLDVIAHEMQHIIQTKEGFPRGSNPDRALMEVGEALVNKIGTTKNPEVKQELMNLFFDIQAKADKFAEYMYLRAPGEVEANIVAARRKLTKEERQKFSVDDTQKILEGSENSLHGGKYVPEFRYPKEIWKGSGDSAMADLTHHMQSPERAKIRLGQLLRDKAASKKAGENVESSDYMFYNTQIRELREYLKSVK